MKNQLIGMLYPLVKYVYYLYKYVMNKYWFPRRNSSPLGRLVGRMWTNNKNNGNNNCYNYYSNGKNINDGK